MHAHFGFVIYRVHVTYRSYNEKKYPKHHHEYKETNVNYIPTASLRFPLEVQIKKLKIKLLYNRIIWKATIPETFVSVFQNSLKIVEQYFILNYIHIYNHTEHFYRFSNMASKLHHMEHGCIKMIHESVIINDPQKI